MKTNRLLSLIIVLFISCAQNKRMDIKDFPYKSNDITSFTMISFDERNHDFGDVNDDTLLVAKYDFKNIGDDTLFIFHILPDCNCTSYEINNDTVLVGETGFIKLRMQTKGKFGMTNSNTRIEVNTKDRFYHLNMTANILQK